MSIRLDDNDSGHSLHLHAAVCKAAHIWMDVWMFVYSQQSVHKSLLSVSSKDRLPPLWWPSINLTPLSLLHIISFMMFFPRITAAINSVASLFKKQKQKNKQQPAKRCADMIGVAVYKRLSASLCAGMKWGWKPAQRWAAPPVTGPPFSRWKLPLLDNQRHCWTFTQTHRVACRPASYSPGHLHASRTGGFFIMRCTAGWNIPARASSAVAAPHWCARISPPCVKTKRCSHTQSTSTRYATLCVLHFFN